MTNPDEKTVTEREAVLRERAAFVEGGRYAERLLYGAPHIGLPDCNAEAVERYPLPKVTRLREVTDGHNSAIQYRYDGGLEYRIGDSPWMSMESPSEVWSINNYPTADRVSLWADLIANPTEEVDA